MNKFIVLIFFLFLIPMAHAQTCYDSDGLDYYTKGYVKFDDTTYYDNCVNGIVLIEGYCAGDHFKTTTNYCTYGCENGKCMAPTTTVKSETTEPSLPSTDSRYVKNEIIVKFKPGRTPSKIIPVPILFSITFS